jgi:hypothetical protein
MRQAKTSSPGFGEGHTGMNIGQFIGCYMHHDLPVADGVDKDERLTP